MSDYLDIKNREEDYNSIYSETHRAELGMRAIGLIYHDHSKDKNSFDNIFVLKDNIEYRIFSATHQYQLLIRELDIVEKKLQILFEQNPNYLNPNTFPFGNPYFDRHENEISSIFDSIIFHLSSVFDYLSHAICYMFFINKQDTLYWTKLAKKVRGDFKDKFNFSSNLDEIDRRFVGRLYNYRSRLLHNKRDKHRFDTLISLNDFSFQLKLACSAECLKQFSIVNNENTGNKIVTLSYLSSWLIKRTFFEIEALLDSIKPDLEKNSNFYENTFSSNAKTGLISVTINPETKLAEPSSNGFWRQYKGKN